LPQTPGSGGGLVSGVLSSGGDVRRDAGGFVGGGGIGDAVGQFTPQGAIVMRYYRRRRRTFRGDGFHID
jgi:hypothetical protein